MKPVYAYIRVSTAKQGEQGVSLQEQQEAIERYAEKNALSIVSCFEEHETAAKRGRPVFSHMLSLLRQGKATGVVIHKIDRSARNLRDWADLGQLIDEGVEIHFAHESLDLHSRGGRIGIKRTGEMFRGAHEPLVSKALFDRVRLVLSGKHRLKVVKHDFIFRRLLTCAECTHALVGERQKGHVYYRCHSRECPMTGIREEPVEQRITEVLSPLSLTPEELEEIRRKIHALRENWDGERDREIRAVALELGNLRERLNRLTDAYLDHMVDKQAFEERRMNLLFEEKAIEDQMREIKDGKHSLPDRLGQISRTRKSLMLQLQKGDSRRKA
jgi:hypothetical protein